MCRFADPRASVTSLLYAKHVIFHPYDGFWDLKHEKRGTLRAALTIVGLVALTHVVMRQYTGFIFNPRDLSKLNVLVELLSVVVSLLPLGGGELGPHNT
jgi:hypothetical protein